METPPENRKLLKEMEGRKEEVKRKIKKAVQSAEREKELAQMREREAREEAVRGQIQAQQQIEEAERRMVATMKKMEKILQTAEREREQAQVEREMAQRKEREAREIAEVESKKAQKLIEETERMRLESIETAKSERKRAEREIAEAQRKEREAREVAEREREQSQLNRKRAEEAEAEARELGTQWIVGKDEIQLTDVELGRGGWGAVMIANFRGVKVAAKRLYKDLTSSYYRDMFSREMNMAARLRHPNLAQFIGASIEGHPIILTELMKTSLRAELEHGKIKHHHVKPISLDVVQALNYLHLMQPHPIIHRDISSANILLDPLPDNSWKAKVTDYGSVNLQKKLQTENPGSPVYSAPEANIPTLQSPKMDIFSFGVLLVEMLTSRFPEVSSRQRLIASIDHMGYQRTIRQCLSEERDQRPSAQQLITTLSDIN